MKLQTICERYAAFRKTLGERFEVNGRQLKAFCRAMGRKIDITDVSPEKVNAFLVGKGPLTTSWYVRHNALLGFYRYAIMAFLDGLEKHGLSVRSRNLRLTALHSFFRYAAFEVADHSAQIQRVLAIPSKRFTRTLVQFLTRAEVDAPLAA